MRLRLAEEERAAEAGRVVAEERLRIARELHDTVAHSMATIAVQAGSALHLLDGDAPPRELRPALTAIRETSKGALTETRSVLGQLRGSESGDHAPGDAARTGLARLEALRAAVTAAGAPVTVTVEGDQRPLPAEADHSAYRILQESLTNVLRHAGPGTAAHVSLRYQPDGLIITVTDDGTPTGGGEPSVSGGFRGIVSLADDQAIRPDGDPAIRPDGDPAIRPDGDPAIRPDGDPAIRPDGDPAVRPDGDPAVLPAGGHGIDGMRERAAAVGGELTAGPLAGGGFQVRVLLPVPAVPAVSAVPAGGGAS